MWAEQKWRHISELEDGVHRIDSSICLKAPQLVWQEDSQKGACRWSTELVGLSSRSSESRRDLSSRGYRKLAAQAPCTLLRLLSIPSDLWSELKCKSNPSSHSCSCIMQARPFSLPIMLFLHAHARRFTAEMQIQWCQHANSISSTRISAAIWESVCCQHSWLLTADLYEEDKRFPSLTSQESEARRLMRREVWKPPRWGCLLRRQSKAGPDVFVCVFTPTVLDLPKVPLWAVCWQGCCWCHLIGSGGSGSAAGLQGRLGN